MLRDSGPAVLGAADPAAVATLIVVGGCVLTVVGFALWASQKKAKREERFLAESRALELERQRREVESSTKHAQIGDVAKQKYELELRSTQQNVEINELVKRKIDLEIRLMEMEVEQRRANERRLTEADGYNRTQVDKLRLEIESLKLHIREQRSRIDDFRANDDD